MVNILPMSRKQKYGMILLFLILLLLLVHQPPLTTRDTNINTTTASAATYTSTNTYTNTNTTTNIPLQYSNNVPYCRNFVSRPSSLTWEQIYALEWNGTPALAFTELSTSFPTTQFTSHVNELVRLIDIDEMESTCFWKFTLTVGKPFSRPDELFCQGKARQRLVPWWCVVLERLFIHNHNHSTAMSPKSANILRANSKDQLLIPILPTSVSFAISSDDYYKTPKKKRNGRKGLLPSPYTCLANSSPNGTFCLTNFLELQRMADHTTYPILPWHQRCTTPIWRGSAWIFHQSSPSTDTILQQALYDCPLCRAVEFSNRFPELLDAKFGDDKNGFFHPSNPQYVNWWKDNTTNGLNVLLPIHFIPAIEYYSHYQVAVVLCGLGAAFRTAIHWSTATAVLLQDCSHHEWYHPWLQPWKHYIPLDKEMKHLNERLLWVQLHPEKVLSIAMAGREFYQEYLSFQRNYEHFYEWTFRLALKKLKLQQTIKE